MKTIWIDCDGKRSKGKAEWIDGVLWAHFDGETFVLQPAKKSARGQVGRSGARSGGADSGLVVSPMPGKIVKIHVREGDLLKLGHALITLEAMKMEYALKAQAAGRLSKLMCRSGDQVVLGQELAVIAVESDASRAVLEVNKKD